MPLLENPVNLSKADEAELRLLCAEIEHRRRVNPLSFYEHLPLPSLQGAFHNDLSHDKCIFGGNRGGKTEEAAEYGLKRGLEKPKQRIWLCSETFGDSVNILQRKVWGLLPKNHIAYGSYDDINGFTNRKLKLKNGTLYMFKCLTRGNLVNMADGSWKEISHIDIGEYIFDSNGNKNKVINKFQYPRTNIILFKIKGHPDTKCTPEHKFYIKDFGWKEAKDIKKGDVLDICSFGGNEYVANWKPSVLALLIAEGCLVTNRSPDFTTASVAVLNKISSVIPSDFQVKKVSDKYAPLGYRLTSKHRVDNRIKKFLIEANLWGKKADSKHIPDFVFKWNREAQKEFIEMLFACDGCITKLVAVYTTASKQLALDIQRLLWNFKVYSCIREVNKRHYRVEISGKRRLQFDLFNIPGKIEKNIVSHHKKQIEDGTVICKEKPSKTQEVFCLEVENTHEFIVNGLRTHNSYDQGVQAFAQDDVDLIINDEEPPYDIYKEQRMRLIDRNGEMVISMTSTKGVTDLIADIFEDCDVIQARHSDILNESLPVIAEKNGMRFYMLWNTDNPYIDQDRLRQEIKLMTRDEIKSRIHGIPINLSGKIYPAFNKRVHVIPFEDAPLEDVQIYHILDPHDRKPWAMQWIILHKTQTSYCIDEYPNRDFNEMISDDKTYDEYVDIIKQKEDTLYDIYHKRVCKRIIDPNFGNKTIRIAERVDSKAHTTPKEELKKRELEFKDGLDSLEAGHLKVREVLHYEMKGLEITMQPKFFITDNCPNTIKHFSRYSRKDIHTAEGDSKDKVGVQEKYKDFCLVAGTKIMTPEGEKNIEDIQEGDMVMTDMGSREVLKSMITGYNRPTIKVTFSNGKTLCGTPNHKVFLKNGLNISLDLLRYNDIMEVWADQKQIIGKSEEADIINWGQDSCIEKYGLKQTAQFLKDFISITKTAINSIINYQILRRLQLKFTGLYIRNLKKEENLTEIKLEKAQSVVKRWQDGIKAKKEGYGLLTILKRLGKIKNQIRENVSFVVKSFLLNSQRQLNFVQINANPLIVGNQVLIMNNVSVLSVANSSLSVNTFQSRPVQDNVVVVLSVEPNSNQTVYNLTVKDRHRYYANGILVSNCDLVRYYEMSNPRYWESLKDFQPDSIKVY